jgi:hypothetical protein
VLGAVAEPGDDIEPIEGDEELMEDEEEEEEEEEPVVVAPGATHVEAAAAAPEAAPVAEQPPAPQAEPPAAAPPPPVSLAPTPVRELQRPTRAYNRLKLARVVLEAGFTGDAVRAAYEALAAAIAALLDDGAPANHTALVASIYRDLVPKGLLAHAAPGVLARLHDLTALESAGVEVDAELARGAVADAEEWVTRLGPAVGAAEPTAELSLL